MKNPYVTLFSLLLIPIFSVAQNNYKAGYMVTLKGDTLNGFISYKTGNKNPLEFTFKDNLNSSRTKTFSAADATAFVIGRYKIYKSFIVDISQNKIGESNVSKTSIKDNVFLNLIDSGKNVTLYQYTDKIKERFFIKEKNTNPVELILHEYSATNYTAELVKQEIYKRQLQSLAVKYLVQYQQTVDEAQQAGYTKEDIEKIVFEINGSDRATTFTSTKENKARPFVGIGLNMLSAHNFSTNNSIPQLTNNYPNAIAKQSASAEINLGEDIFLNQKEKAIILRIEFHVTYSGNSTITDNQSGTLLEKYRTLTVSLNPQLLFDVYNSGSTKIYIGAGWQLFGLGGAKVSYTNKNYNELNPPAYYAGNFIFTTTANVVLNNKFDIYAGYSPAMRLQQNSVSSFSAGINYLFGIK
jgi:hypothetical protein